MAKSASARCLFLYRMLFLLFLLLPEACEQPSYTGYIASCATEYYAVQGGSNF